MDKTAMAIDFLLSEYIEVPLIVPPVNTVISCFNNKLQNCEHIKFTDISTINKDDILYYYNFKRNKLVGKVTVIDSKYSKYSLLVKHNRTKNEYELNPKLCYIFRLRNDIVNIGDMKFNASDFIEKNKDMYNRINIFGK